ncbi:primosomal protein N' [Solimicrobium silvestre]|uniref:primosomal protein N' n=1 Tax=Solimicrobium silvestre TaxID=2099400 RepID=UPI001FAFF724|nr:primosomal protein N' [Solimicrobium silvestre]
MVLDTPLERVFDYLWTGEETPQVGQFALLTFGRREMVGLIVAMKQNSDIPRDKLKSVLTVRQQLSPVSSEWIALCSFAADYYQRPLGEVALPAIPKNCRTSKTTALDKALKKLSLSLEVKGEPSESPQLNAAQQNAVQHIVDAKGYAPSLLYGVTGSGKTEVYLQAAAQVLARDASAQILILVPEINLTPQLQGHFQARFPELTVAVLHSGMAEGERTLHWLAAHTGKARLILGTRLAILASLPALKLIIIDEEHDPSYKQQEGLRYSARDLAIWRARQLNIPVVLGSATPSLETWQHTISGRYVKLSLPDRAVAAAVLPKMRLIDIAKDRPQEGLTASLISALKQRLDKGEQSLLYLNRRGYAPVIACDACGWMSNCTRCSAFLVLHKQEHKLRCHHCSFELRIPKSCPTCGNSDIQPLGRGTQRIEENLQKFFPDAKIRRIDADSTRLKGSAQAAFETVHRGEVDILIGTQMVAKGHDFKNLTLVGVINPDNALFSQDYRAGERLFAQLMQVSGRAGRAAQKEGGSVSEVLVQTRYPQHPLYHALKTHDYPRFAKECLAERQQAGLPPFIFQALLRAEAKELQIAIAFLRQAAELNVPEGIIMHDPIPMSLMKMANSERAQLLIESHSRPALQAFLKEWLLQLRTLKPRITWSLEVDPVDI